MPQSTHRMHSGSSSRAPSIPPMSIAGPITHSPRLDLRTESVDDSCDLMARHPGIGNARPIALFDKHITVADPQASILTRTAPGAGSGRVFSITANAAPALEIRTAFIVREPSHPRETFDNSTSRNGQYPARLQKVGGLACFRGVPRIEIVAVSLSATFVP